MSSPTQHPDVPAGEEKISVGGRIGVLLLLFTAFLVATIELGRLLARLLSP